MKFFKIFSWLALILTGILLILWALIFKSMQVAIAVAIVAAATWGGWAVLMTWLFGIRRHVCGHLGIDLKSATYQEKDVGASRLNDLRRALERLLANERFGRRYGYDVQHGYASLASLQDGNLVIRTLQWATLETSPGYYENYPTNAVYLLHLEEVPFAATLHTVTASRYEHMEEAVAVRQSGEKLQIFARSIDEGTAVINGLMRTASEHSVYRGKLLKVSPNGPGVPGQAIRMTERTNVDIEKIVLPAEIFDVLERSIAARLKYHGLLQRHGHISKTGILLHGAPGTGKTLVCKHLIGSCDQYTTIVPAAMETDTIREAFRLAAYLHPSLVVIEDVDLLAERRETNANVTSLQELMNEMDGLSPTAETIVLMTTNRPELLEPALASRPGRVTQAILFPLPDRELREKLLRLFCGPADIGQVDLTNWIDRTDGASPAFLEELTKKAIIFAAERAPADAVDETLTLTDRDFDQAIHELVIFGGNLTSNTLGFPTSPEIQ